MTFLFGNGLRVLFWMASICVFSFGSLAQSVLAEFDFEGATGKPVSFPDNESARAPNLIVGEMTRGSGVSMGRETTDAFSAASWPTEDELDFTNSEHLNSYFEFSLTPAPLPANLNTNYNHRIRLDSFSFCERRTGTGPTRWELRTSTDGFVSNNLLVGEIGMLPDEDEELMHSRNFVNPNGEEFPENLEGTPYSNLTGKIDFRIYAYGAESNAGNWRIDDVIVRGDVIVPEPSTYGIAVAIFALGFGLLRRRFRRIEN